MEWISVKERLPEVLRNWSSEFVIVCHGNSFNDKMGVWMCYMNENEDFFDNEGQRFEGVTHWMPLPEPPKHQ